MGISLTVANAASLTWDASNTTAGNQDGSGSWDTTSLQWNSSSTAWNNATPDSAIFGVGSGAAGVVNLGTNITVAGLTFNAPGSGSYVLASSGPILTLGTTTSLTIAVNASATITAPLAMAGNSILTKTGTNTLTLAPTANSTLGQISNNSPGTIILSGTASSTTANPSTGGQGGSMRNLQQTGTWDGVNPLNGTIKITGGTWSAQQLGTNNTNMSFRGTLQVSGGELDVTTSGRYIGSSNSESRVIVDGGTLKFMADRFSPGSDGTTAGMGSASISVSAGTLEVYGMTNPNNFGVGYSSSFVQTGGTVIYGVSGSGGNKDLRIGGNTVNVKSHYTLSGGTLRAAAAVTSVATPSTGGMNNFNFRGGTLAAASFVATNLGYSTSASDGVANSTSAGTLTQLGGTLAPGDVGTAGRTAITGSYNLGSGGTLAVDLGGTTQATAFQTGLYDYLTVSGTTTLAGNLSVNVLSGFTPSASSTFTILNSTGTLSGAFANVAFGSRIASTSGLQTFVVSKSGNTVTLSQYQPLSAPTISSSAGPATVLSGNALTFSVTASSLAPVTYEWRRNGVTIPGATSSSLTLNQVDATDGGTYDVILTNAAGSVTKSFTVAVTNPPPASSVVLVTAGISQDFGAAASATSYAWTLDGATVGTNNATYTYAPDVNAVGTHWLRVKETYADNSAVYRQWTVRVRFASSTATIQYYVSPTGSDSGSGSIGSPFLTLEKARDTIRTLTRPLPAGGVVVYLRGGTYTRTSTFSLTSSDSGSSGAPIVYTSYPGETAVISGGKSLLSSQFTALSATETSRVAPGVDVSRIWEADLTTLGAVRKGPFPNTYGEWQLYNALSSGSSAGVFEVFYNGKRMYLSRYPNHNLTDDTLTTNLSMNGVAAGADTAGTGYLNSAGNYTDSNGNVVAVGGAFQYNTADASHVSRWQTAMTKGGVWVVGYWRVPWQINGVKVGVLDTGTKKTIGFASGASVSNGIGYKYSRPLGNKAEPWWVVNLLEELDQPGEWCIDFSRNKLYFLMDAAGAPPDNSVVVSDLGTSLVQIAGSYVNLQGISFQYGLGQGVQVLGGTRNLVAGCTFKNIGNYAVDLNNISGGTYNGVVGCTMSELASGGVIVRGGNKTSSPRVPNNNYVVNNRITDYARVVRVYAASVDLGFQYGGPSVGVRVAHNTVRGSPHVGMLWKDYDHIFEYNDVGDYCQFSDDMGGIYNFNSNYVSNAVIRYNYVHDSDHGDGIYFDSDHINATVYGNTVNLHTVSSEGRGYCFFDQRPGGTPAAGVPLTDTTYNNIAVNGHFGYNIYTAAGGVIENNLAYNNTTAYNWNLVTAGATAYTITASSAAALASGPNQSYTTDLGFMDFSNDDLRLRPDSQVYTDLPNVQPHPLEMAGLYNDEFRSDANVYTPFITTSSATALGSNTATFNAILTYPQFDPNATVLLYWGTADGGTTAASWQNVANLGTPGSGLVSKTFTNLTPGTKYYFRFYVSNAAGSMWSEDTNSTTTFAQTSLATGGNASASSAATSAATAFDGSATTAWQTVAGVTTASLQYQFAGSSSAVATQYLITSAADTPARDPRDWTFQGSNDGVNWTTLDTQAGQTFTSRGQTLTYGFANTTAYAYYRLNITANNGDSSSLQLAELIINGPLLTPDTLGPVITTPGNLTVPATSTSGANVDFTVTAEDALSGFAPVTVSPLPGSLFAVGTTTVTATASDSYGNSSTATFTVTVQPYNTSNVGAPWTVQNIGTQPTTAGSATSSGGGTVFNVTGTGGTSGTNGDIWLGTSEGFTYIWQPWSGDGIFTARVASFSSTDSGAKAGIMFRETLSTGSKNSITYMTRGGSANGQHKTATNGSSTNTNFFSTTVSGKSIPYWVRLVRSGNNFSNYISSDGVTWTQVGVTKTNVMTGTALNVGLAAAPRTGGTTATVTFDNVSFQGVPAAPTNFTATGGNGQNTLSWSAVSGATGYTIRFSATQGGPYTTDATGVTATTYLDTGLAPGTTYYYTVSATNAAGESASSPEALATTYSPQLSWKQTNFGTTVNTGASADLANPDGDALNNLLEYSFGGNPVLGDKVSPVVAANAQGNLQVTFNRARSDVTYIVEASSDLVNWTTVATNPGTIGSSVTTTDSVVSTRRFLRVRITSP